MDCDRVTSLGGVLRWLTGGALHEARAQARLLIAENLLAVHRTALLRDLDQTDLERIFYRNADTLFQRSE